jgi:hypothetical protein
MQTLYLVNNALNLIAYSKFDLFFSFCWGSTWDNIKTNSANHYLVYMYEYVQILCDCSFETNLTTNLTS